MRRGTSILWHRIESAPVTQLAFVFLLAAIFNLLDPLSPTDAWTYAALSTLILGTLVKIVARLADNRKREWPLHVECSGNALVAASFLLVATKAATFAGNWQELAGVYVEYGLLAGIFLLRLLAVWRAIRLLNRARDQDR